MKFLRIRASIALVAAGLMIFGVTAPSASAAPQDDAISLTNEQRTAAGLPALIADPQLNAAAQEWAQSMANSGSMIHSSNEWRSARIPAGWFTNGENIAYGYRSASAVVSGWMNSTGHRDNIMRSSFTHIGVGYVASGNYWVQIFAGYDVVKAARVFGSFDEAISSVTADAASITARGWTLDDVQKTTPTSVHIWVADPAGVQTRYITTANQSRPDIGRAFSGAGDSHGFSVTIPVTSSGSYTVCPSAITPQGSGSKITGLGCKNVLVGPSRPIGSLDEAAVRTEGSTALISLRGWAMDTAVKAASTPVHAYITSPSGRVSSFAVSATGSRPDVGAAFPGAGANHGFESRTVITEPGIYKVCVYAIGGSVFASSHSSLSCRELRFGPTAPIGAFDSVTVDRSAGTLRASGWSLDRGFATVPTETHLYVTSPDGRTVGYIAVSDRSRPDVGSAFPGAGSSHGYTIDIPLAGPGVYSVCTYPISAKQLGSGHSTLPCKQVRVSD